MTTPIPTLPVPYYHRDGITLYLGDAAQIAPLLPPSDLLLTDPPYGLNIAASGKLGRSNLRFTKSNWDKSPPAPWLLDSLRHKAGAQIVWGGNYFQLPPGKGWPVWHKLNPQGLSFADCELAWTNLDTVARVFTWSWTRHRSDDERRKVHVTQKPMALMNWCLDLAISARGAVRSVLDPFAGAATTLIACLRRGIACTGIELDPEICKLAAARLAAA